MAAGTKMAILAVSAALLCVVPAVAQPLPANLDKADAIVIDTTKGRIVIKLRTDLAPKHAERIKQLAREGYYNNVPFHRVIEGFMAQTGDGKNFNGTGGSKYPNLPAEFSNVPYKRGIVGMARTSDPNSANSQFFIMFADGSSLNGKYTVIGEVVSGMDVVQNAVGLCDRLIVAIGVHPGKKPLFSTEERLEMVRAVFGPIAAKAGCDFDATTYDNLTVTAAQKAGATIMIRGLRDGTDLDYEMQIAGMNETMAPEVHTVFLPASVAVRPITATLVRQIAAMGGDVSAFVPPSVAASLKTKFAG